jgi:hypothetical protein
MVSTVSMRFRMSNCTVINKEKVSGVLFTNLIIFRPKKANVGTATKGLNIGQALALHPRCWHIAELKKTM